MKVTIFAIALLASSFASAAQHHLGQDSFCLGGRKHNLRYNTTLRSDHGIYEIDSFSGLKDLNCDNDGSRLKITFHDEVHSTALWLKFKTGNAFLTGGDKHGCPMASDPSKGFLLRRVNAAQLNGQQVIVSTSYAQYDEIYSDADISYGSMVHADCIETDKPVCVGVNTDTTCKSAKAPLPVYSNSMITLTCDNCFAALAMDVVFDIKIHDFQLQSLQGGFKNISVNSALDIDMQATKSWSAGVDKDMTLAGGVSNPVVSFKIGPVPFIFWFEAKQHIKGDAQLQATAEAKAGVTMQYAIGDSYISWDPENKWQHHKPSPTLLFNHAISGSAQFQGTAGLSVIPSVALHVNQLYSYTLTLDPSVNMQIQGDTANKKICETVDYGVNLATESELHLNIGWAHVHQDRQWGPSVIWQNNGTLSNACVGANN